MFSSLKRWPLGGQLSTNQVDAWKRVHKYGQQEGEEESQGGADEIARVEGWRRLWRVCSCVWCIRINCVSSLISFTCRHPLAILRIEEGMFNVSSFCGVVVSCSGFINSSVFRVINPSSPLAFSSSVTTDLHEHRLNYDECLILFRYHLVERCHSTPFSGQFIINMPS